VKSIKLTNASSFYRLKSQWPQGRHRLHHEEGLPSCFFMFFQVTSVEVVFKEGEVKD
jgi:hypothetical protein